MSNLMKLDPMRDMLTLRDLVDRMFDDMYVNTSSVGDAFGLTSVDMYQTQDEVVVQAVIPGVKPDDLQISITGDTLTLRGEIKQETEKGKGNEPTYHIRERRFGSFSRSIQLPVQVNADQARANVEHGILTLVLPKAEEVRPRTISVHSN